MPDLHVQEAAESAARAAAQRADAVEAEAIRRLEGHLRSARDTADRAARAEGRAAQLERQLAEAAARHEQAFAISSSAVPTLLEQFTSIGMFNTGVRTAVRKLCDEQGVLGGFRV